MKKAATVTGSLPLGARWGESQTIGCTRRKPRQVIFGQGFDSPRLHQTENTIAIRTLMVWTRWCFCYITQYYAAFRGWIIGSEKEIANYNDQLDSWERNQGYQINVEDSLVSIDSYEKTTFSILKKPAMLDRFYFIWRHESLCSIQRIRICYRG